MADDTTQRIAHRFFLKHLQTLDTFTKDDVREATGWSKKSAEAYWSKQFKNILEEVPGKRYRVRERFRLYTDWKKFKNLVTQVKTPPPSYAPTVYEEVVVYEFYMPLSHENALRVTLDSLFYRDVIEPRLLHRIGISPLKAHFEYLITDTNDSFIDKICKFVESKFAGYSIYHVDGRFRAGDLLTRKQAFEMSEEGQDYLVNETTAVTRFVFPCLKNEADKVRFLFKHLFMDPITEQVSGEDQIWVVEGGSRNHVQVWKPKT
jgi:hypothetical protein